MKPRLLPRDHRADLGTGFIVGPTLLEHGAGDGPLKGVTFAAKDLFDVAGERTGAGSPEWLQEAQPAVYHSSAVAGLLGAGADLWGKTITDELAFSLAGTNVHYGTPCNPRAPGRIPGGSSAGSAVAVATGTVPLALGTDTAGSTRVPASYCGIIGFRPTFGRISLAGTVPLAPSFDTVGIFADSIRVLSGALTALLAPRQEEGEGSTSVKRLILSLDLFGKADSRVSDAVLEAVYRFAKQRGLMLEHGELLGPAAVDACRDAFRARQLSEVWQTHGDWISGRRPNFGPGVAARFAMAKTAPRVEDATFAGQRRRLEAVITALLGEDAILVFPATGGPAPLLDLDDDEKERVRTANFALNSPASLGGVPQLVLPLAEVDGLPVGVAFLGRAGDDERLIEFARCHVD
ncbi:amidase [Ferrimicrobium sp.]|uniref:amidase n=1 Tax=Ferrimicrobium sp. TaxID=2926050 RepID=UPI00262D13E2|nr:amidase [Ferrimicrobium sp.]